MGGKVAAAGGAKAMTYKQGVRAVGEARMLAFASEVGVAGQPVMPRYLYFGMWGLSGAAVTADITTRYWDAADDKKINTVLYWSAFHVPASLIIPAAIIHKIVHGMEHSMQHHSYAKNLPPRVKVFVPVV